MKIITCASYYGSGSSAISDLVAEYSNVKDLSDFEFSLLHDVDGIRDLEYNLVENHNRNNSGHALKRFKRLAEFNAGNKVSKRYSHYLDRDAYKEIINKYVNSLVDSKFQGWWFADLYDKGDKGYYFYQLINHIFRKMRFINCGILKNEFILQSHPSEARFIKTTQEFVTSLIQLLNQENKEYIEIDQLTPSSNIKEYLRYIKEDCYVFVVDRDPRDVFLLNKYCWREEICPMEVNQFCDWFIYARKAGNRSEEKPHNVIKIQFEDIIYRYDEICKTIENVTGLNSNNHLNKFKKMNPKRSVANTRLWEKYNDPDIVIIENRLKDYLYDYSNVNIDSVEGVDNHENGVF